MYRTIHHHQSVLYSVSSILGGETVYFDVVVSAVSCRATLSPASSAYLQKVRARLNFLHPRHAGISEQEARRRAPLSIIYVPVAFSASACWSVTSADQGPRSSAPPPREPFTPSKRMSLPVHALHTVWPLAAPTLIAPTLIVHQPLFPLGVLRASIVPPISSPSFRPLASPSPHHPTPPPP